MARKVRGKKQILGKKITSMADVKIIGDYEQRDLALEDKGTIETKLFRCLTDHEIKREVVQPSGIPFCPRCGIMMVEDKTGKAH